MRTVFLASIAAVTCLSAAPAFAATNYFECSATEATTQEVSNYRITTDDERGEVTYEVIANGNIFKRPAIFTPDSVVWTSEGASEVLRNQWTISRIDLSFDISLFIGGKVSSPRKGMCTKIEAPKRAF